MKVIFSEKTVLKAEIDKVWEYFINLEENGAKWMPSVSDVQVTPGNKIENGSIIKQTSKGKELISSVTECLSMNHITFTATQGNIRVNYTYTFLKEGESTSITLVAKVEAKGFIKIMLPIIKKAIKTSDSGQLAKFRESFFSNRNDITSF